MNILLTGCAGFIGSHLAEKLLHLKHNVFGVDNFDPYYSESLKRSNLAEIEKTARELDASFHFESLDICNSEKIRELLNSNAIETVVHLAALAGVRPSLEKPCRYAKVNVEGTTNLLEEARKKNIKNFVFASSSSVYGNYKETPFNENIEVDSMISHYATTKRAGELTCKTYHNLYNMSIACLRFFTVYGPRQRPDLAINKFTHKILQGDEISIYGDGSKKRDFTYIDDIIEGTVKAINWTAQATQAAFEIFNLGEAKTTDVNTLIAMIEEAAGKDAKRKYEPNVAGDVLQTFADITKAKQILGYNPKTDISEGIQKYVHWVKERI
ncbi:MAG: GDP-mannose 4,6-dehydratase [bacterium]|nr:GDP-mannose 4,6-dehydratase [bacterium]MBU1916671.1 GDP-mannose 4,6-dehydratase [bacterium]